MEGTRLFVGNLSYRVRWQDLKDFFNEHCGGEVVYADVKSDWQGRSAGCGIVELKTPQEAADAILRMHDMEFEGRKIFVRQDREKEDRDRDFGGGRGGSASRYKPYPSGGKGGGSSGGSGRGCKIFVQNIAYETSWQNLKDHFRQAGDVIRADIKTDHRTGRSSGNAIVEFAHPDSPDSIIAQLNEVPLDGRPLYIREDRMPDRNYH